MIKMREKSRQILRWSERYIKTDMTYLIRGGFWLTAAQALTSFFVLISAVVFANFLSKEVYGTYKFIVSLAGIIGAFSLSGMISSVTRAIAKGADGSLRGSMPTLLKWNAILSIIGVLGSSYYYLNNNLELALGLLIVAIFLPFRKTFFIYDSFFQGRKMFKERAFYGVTAEAAAVLVVIATALFFNNALAMVLAFFASYAVIYVVLYVIVIKKYRLPRTSDPETLSYGKHLSLMNVLNNFASQIDNVLLFHYVGPAQLAIYSFASAPPKEIGAFSSALQSLVLPKVSSRDVEELKRTLPRKAGVAFLLSFLVFLTYVIAAPYIFMFAFPAYTDSVLISQVFALTILLFPAALFSQTLVGHMQKQKLYVVNTAIPTLKIALLLILLPLYGVWGAVFTLIIARAVQFLMLYYFFKKI